MSGLMKIGLTGNGAVASFPQFIDDNGVFDKTKGKGGANAMDYIGRELKLDLHLKREKSLVSAATNPAQFLTERTNAMKNIKERVAYHYAQKLQKLELAKFPFDEANAIASRSANHFYEEELQELEWTNPGMATVYSSAAHTMTDRNDKFNLAMGVAEERAAYKRYKAKKQTRGGSKKKGLNGPQ